MNISTEKKKRTFYINKEILAKLDVISESKGIQKSKLVEEALQQFLQQYDFNNTSHFDN